MRPYPVTTLAELLRATAEGATPPPPRGTAVPQSVHDAIHRSLRPEPDQRYPDMASLLEALETALAER